MILVGKRRNLSIPPDKIQLDASKIICILNVHDISQHTIKLKIEPFNQSYS